MKLHEKNNNSTAHNLVNLIYMLRNSHNNSIARILQNIEINNLNLTGTILDFGGGKKTKYNQKLNIHHSLNISKKYNPTHLIDEKNKDYPVSNNFYDHIVSFNTFEHVFDAELVLNKLAKKIKKNGKFIIIVPFMHRIHADPDDYHRLTPSWFNKNTSLKLMKVKYLVWGPLTTMLNVIDNNFFLFKIIKLISIIIDYIIIILLKKIFKRNMKSLSQYPTSIMIHLKKI